MNEKEKATFLVETFIIKRGRKNATNERKVAMSKKMLNHVLENKEIYVGLEDSKRTWKVCVRCEGIVVQEASMAARYDILKAFFDNNYPGCIIAVIYEAGFKGFTLHDKLVNDGLKCIVIPPHRVKQEKGNRVKCDKRDARDLAKQLEVEKDFCAQCAVPDEERRQDRQVSRTLIQIQKEITRCKNRIRKFLDFHGFDEEFVAGRWYDREYQVLETLDVADSLQFCLDFYRQQLAMLTEAKKTFSKKLRELSKKARYNKTFEVFRSAPGVGWFTAIRLVLEWGEDLTRFDNGKKFASFVGLTPKEFSTGESIRRGRITGQSNPSIRAWLIECGWTAYKRDPVLLKKFRTVWGATGSKKKAVVAVARMLAVRLYALAKNGTPYQIGIAV